MNTIILSAGKINYSNLPINTTRSNAMVPVNGKPVIGWILDDLLDKDIQSVTIVLRDDDSHLNEFLRWAYVERMDLNMLAIPPGGSIIESLWHALNTITEDGGVRVVLGDTLIRDSFEEAYDYVYIGNVEDSKRWCLVNLSPQGYVEKYIEKQDYPHPEKYALAGYYHFLDRAFLSTCVDESLAAGERELSFALSRYGEKYPLKATQVQEWFDFGNLDNLINARSQLLQSRYFNSLNVNPVLNTLTKISQDNEKLQDELDWYQELPTELQVLTPRIVDYQKTNGDLSIVQEYYGYPSLAEHYLYSSIDEETWLSILQRVIRVHNEFRSYAGSLDSNEVISMFYKKTVTRLDMLRAQDEYWHKLLEGNKVAFNGEQLDGIDTLLPIIEKKARALAKSVKPTIIHGDLCFSNILFDVNNQIIRLIDPRGSFGVKGIYGDPRYDIAKLRHSIVGLYDFIIADLFTIQEEMEGVFSGKIFSRGIANHVATAFDRLIVDEGYDLDEIKFIEGLLFLSMMPYHKEKLKRQQMMFLQGLTLLNEV